MERSLQCDGQMQKSKLCLKYDTASAQGIEQLSRSISRQLMTRQSPRLSDP